MEEALDLEFFTSSKEKEIKLSKAEKRALKFALARGENIDQIANLKEFLNQ
jgi:hypothetical protein